MVGFNNLVKNVQGTFTLRRTVRQTAKILTILCVFLLLMVEVFVCYSTVKSNAEKLYLSITREVISSYSNTISQLINRYNANLMFFTSKSTGDSREEIVEKLKSHASLLADDLLTVFYADESGFAYMPDSQPVPIYDRRYYYEMIFNKKDYYFDSPVISKTYEVPIIHINQAAYDKDGRRQGFFSIVVPIRSIELSISENNIIKRGNVFITDTDGNFILRPKYTFISKNYKRSRVSDKKIDFLLDTMALQMSGFMKMKGQDEKQYIVVYTPIKETPWTLATVVPANEMLSSFSSLGYRMLVALLISTCSLVFLFAIVLVIIVLRKIYKISKHDEPIDSLTGLWTLSHFEKEIKVHLDKNPNKNYMFVSFDIQGLKFINQTYSEHVGNDMLIMFGENLSTFAKTKKGYCSRGYADHFYLFVPVINRQKLLEDFCSQFYTHKNISNNEIIPVLIKSGIVFTGKDYGFDSVSALIEKASYARREIKGNYEKEFLVFDEKLHEKIIREKRIESCISQGFENREFYVVYQPKISISNGRVVGAEALVRWDSAKIGKVMPDDFVPIFERNGSIIKLDFFVYESVFKLLHDNLKNNIPVVPISVNMSRFHTNSLAFLNMFDKMLKQYQIPPSLIEIEILERSVSRGNDGLKNVIDGLHTRGFRVSMDDFGAGESSLNMLDTIPVDTLKIDKNFLREQNDWESTKRIIMKIVELARDLKKTVVCEGVENEEQVKFLNSINCDIAQGFFYSKPLLSWELSEFLTKHGSLVDNEL